MNSDDRPVVGYVVMAHALFHAYELSIPVFVVVWLEMFTASKALLGRVVGVGYAAIGLDAVPSGVLAGVAAVGGLTSVYRYTRRVPRGSTPRRLTC